MRYFIILLILPSFLTISFPASADEYMRYNERQYISCNKNGANAAAARYGNTYMLARSVERSCNHYLMRMRDSEGYRKMGRHWYIYENALRDSILTGNVNIINAKRRRLYNGY